MAGAYTDQELQRLDDLGQRREAVAKMDIRQRHLSEFTERSTIAGCRGARRD